MMRHTMGPAVHRMPHVITSLVVDDSASVRRLLRGMLEGDGYVVHEAPDGHVALDLLRRNLLRYVVLLDYTMSGLNGWEVLCAAEVEGGDLFTQHAFILMTATLEQVPAWCITFLKERDIPLIEKPITGSALTRVMADAAARLIAH